MAAIVEFVLALGTLGTYQIIREEEELNIKLWKWFQSPWMNFQNKWLHIKRP
jgi:hypothetical protein